MQYSTVVFFTGALLALDVFMLLATVVTRWIAAYRKARFKRMSQAVEQHLCSRDTNLAKLNPAILFPVYQKLKEAVVIPKAEENKITQRLLDSALPTRFIEQLYHPWYVKRAEAASRLTYLDSKRVQTELLLALKREKHPVVVLYLAHALSLQKVRKAIPLIVRKLDSTPGWFAPRIRAVLYSYGKDFKRYATMHTQTKRTSLSLLLCGFAAEYPCEDLLPFLLDKAMGTQGVVRKAALAALLANHPQELLKEPFIASEDLLVASHVICAFGKRPVIEHVEGILSYTRIKQLHETIVDTLTEMTTLDPTLLPVLLQMCTEAQGKDRRRILAKVLESRIEYFLMHIKSPMHHQVSALIRTLAGSNHVSSIVFFLNRNKDMEIERAIVAVLKRSMARNERLGREVALYLDKAIQQRNQLQLPQLQPEPPKPHAEKPLRLHLAVLFIAVMLAFPLIILSTEFPNLVSLGWAAIGRLYVVRFNYLLAIYAITINSIYLVMLGISFHGARVQRILWNAKDKRFLYTKGVLPSVSIIAPAFNEEAGIIDSVNSLLNQRYPDFELIVVNDGSKDGTLDKLIAYFKLEKHDRTIRQRLNTRSIRGIYTTRNIPNLIVVDKMNGGKADSLNCGLNSASKEYFCGIDADSLLEPEALLRAVSVMIDSPQESIAAGGNIYPVNGCTVDHGHLDTVELPKQFLPRLQSLEYTRAFMTGRVGWAHINCLLIISGAFGIFNRERSIRTGGYLTKSGKYGRDTVGEDMELVVRLSRYMREQHIPYSVDYAFNANCWTEVPATWKLLHRQRDRWHRGLVDIMMLHRHMVANPKYGRLGMVGMLYYFLFELIGPFVEAQGLLMVVVAASIGILNTSIALLLFSATILLGILVSVSAVFISEFDRDVYRIRDVFRLLWMAVVENFGIRQYISLWRVTGYFSAMRKGRGWGAQVRKGFTTQQGQQGQQSQQPTDRRGQTKKT